MDRCAAATLDPRPGQPHGSVCREWDGREPGWAADGGPLCTTELRVAERDTRALLYDYVDLEQMLPRTLSQALDTQPAGKPGPPIPLSVAPEALQAEIAWVLTTWEAEVRDRCRLSPPRRPVAAPWHTTLSNPPPEAKMRTGAAVQRAVTVLAPRMLELSRIPPTTVFPRGCEDTPDDVAGWQAVLTLSHLHQRARTMLGRTRRTTRVPGSCSYPDPADGDKTCGGDLYRDEPRYEGDPCDVYCSRCPKGRWPQREYEHYVGFMLALPARDRVAA